MDHTITRLFSLMKDTEPSVTDLKLDLPRVHALNLMLVVFKESNVAQSAHKHLAQATMIAIQGFSSAHWAIRNSSTQLFSELNHISSVYSLLVFLDISHSIRNLQSGYLYTDLTRYRSWNLIYMRAIREGMPGSLIYSINIVYIS